jgi:hypothetical protein
MAATAAHVVLILQNFIIISPRTSLWGKRRIATVANQETKRYPVGAVFNGD